MTLQRWTFTFSLVSAVTAASVGKDIHREDSSKFKNDVPGDSVFFNDISTTSEESLGDNLISPNLIFTEVFHPGRASAVSTISLNTSSYATGYQQKPAGLAPSTGQGIFFAASETLPVVAAPTHGEKVAPLSQSPLIASETLHKNRFIVNKHPFGLIGGSPFGRFAEERQSRPHRRPPRPLFNPQRPGRRPFFRATSTTLVPPPPRPTPPLPEASLHSSPLVNAPDISLIPLQPFGDSGTNDILDERFPPFNDEPFPPFNAEAPSPAAPQPSTRNEPTSLTTEVPVTLNQQVPQQPSTPLPRFTPQVPLRESTPTPQSIPQLPLQQSTPVPQFTLQLQLQQGSPVPQAASQLPPQQNIQQSTPVPREPAQQDTSSLPRQPTPPSFQQISQTQLPNQLQIQSQGVNQPEVHHNLQQHLRPPSTSQRIPKQVQLPQPHQASPQQPQQISQQGLQLIPQLPFQQENAPLFPPIQQQFSPEVPQSQQQFLVSSIPPPQVRIPRQGSTSRPQHFRSPPQRNPHNLQPPRIAGRPQQPVGFRNTRQPRFAAQTRRPRQLERHPQRTEQRRPGQGRDSALSTGEVSQSTKHKQHVKEEEEVSLVKVRGHLQSVFSTPPPPKFPKFPDGFSWEFGDTFEFTASPIGDSFHSQEETHHSGTGKGHKPTEYGEGQDLGNVKAAAISNLPRPQHIKATGKGIIKNIGRVAETLAKKATKAANALGQVTGEALGEGVVLLGNVGTAVIEAVHELDDYPSTSPMTHSIRSGLHLTVPHEDHVREHKFGLQFSLSSSHPGAGPVGPLPIVDLGFNSEVVSKPLRAHKKKRPSAFLKPFLDVDSSPIPPHQEIPLNIHLPRYRWAEKPIQLQPGPGIKDSNPFVFDSDGFLIDDEHSSPHLPEYDDISDDDDGDDGLDHETDYDVKYKADNPLKDYYHGRDDTGTAFNQPRKLNHEPLNPSVPFKSLRNLSRFPCQSLETRSQTHHAPDPRHFIPGPQPSGVLCKPHHKPRGTRTANHSDKASDYPLNIQDIKLIISDPSYPGDYYRQSLVQRDPEPTRKVQHRQRKSPLNLSFRPLGLDIEDSLTPFGSNEEVLGAS